jgi:hypothetical protein
MMDISKDQFRDRDIFIDYDFENVIFRYEYRVRRFFRKFYDETKWPTIISLLNDAMWFGDEIDVKTYQAGKPVG